MFDYFGLTAKRLQELWLSPSGEDTDFTAPSLNNGGINSVMVQTNPIAQKQLPKEQVIPLVNQPKTTQTNLDAAGNIPIVNNTKKEETMGLGIEKTAQKVQTGESEQSKADEKRKESLNQFFGRYYSKFEKSSDEQKVKYMKQYFNSLDEKKQAQEFERLRQRGYDTTEIEHLAETISALKTKNILKAQNDVMNNGTAELNKAGRRGVAKTMQEYDPTVRQQAVKNLVQTGDKEAILIGSSHASEFGKENETAVVGIYQSIDDKDVNKILIDQYEKYAKENQVDIHKIMSGSKLSETVEYAASNIYKFDKSNQVAATKVTIATGNEAAINAAAAQYGKYDKSVQSEVSSTLSSSGYASVNNTLAKSVAENTSGNSYNSSSSNFQTTESSTPKQSNSTDSSYSEKVNEVKKILSSNDPNYQSKLEDAIKDFTPAQIINLLSSISPDRLLSVIKIIYQNNPSPEVTNSIENMISQGRFDPKTTKELIAMIGDNSASTKIFASQPLFSSNAAFVEYIAEKGDLGLINKNNLSGLAKIKYMALIKDQDKRNEKGNVA